MQMRVRTNIPDVRRIVGKQRSQVPFATMLAINKTAKDVNSGTPTHLKTKLNNPKRWTLNGTYIVPAKKGKLIATVGFKDKFGGKGVPAGKYLDHMEHGGPRGATRMELALRASGKIESNEYLVKADGVNITKGKATKILSQMKALEFGSATSSARSTKSRRAGSFFIPQEPRNGTGSGLPRAIWMRQGIFIKPVYWIVSGAPRYGKTLGWNKYAEKMVRKKFAGHFATAFMRAIETAR